MINNLEKSKNTKIKFFTIFKLINSIIYFIPSCFCIGIAVALNITFLILGSGGSKITNTSSLADAIIYISFFSLVPAILSLILFILTLIYRIQVFRKKYNKIIDLIICILFLIINTLLIIFLFELYTNILIILITIIIIFSIIIIANIIFTILLLVNNKKNN